MKEDIHYTNLMLEFENLNSRLDSLEEILEEYACSRHTPAIRNKSINAEEFSRFWNETKLTEENGV